MKHPPVIVVQLIHIEGPLKDEIQEFSYPRSSSAVIRQAMYVSRLTLRLSPEIMLKSYEKETGSS